VQPSRNEGIPEVCTALVFLRVPFFVESWNVIHGVSLYCVLSFFFSCQFLYLKIPTILNQTSFVSYILLISQSSKSYRFNLYAVLLWGPADDSSCLIFFIVGTSVILVRWRCSQRSNCKCISKFYLFHLSGFLSMLFRFSRLFLSRGSGQLFAPT
jgi:hypothetical protein